MIKLAASASFSFFVFSPSTLVQQRLMGHLLNWSTSIFGSTCVQSVSNLNVLCTFISWLILMQYKSKVKSALWVKVAGQIKWLDAPNLARKPQLWAPLVYFIKSNPKCSYYFHKPEFKQQHRLINCLITWSSESGKCIKAEVLAVCWSWRTQLYEHSAKNWKNISKDFLLINQRRGASLVWLKSTAL